MSEHPYDLIERAMRLRAEQNEEPPSFQLLVGEDMEQSELAELWLVMVETQRAARNVVAAIADELGTAMGQSGEGTQIGEDWVFYKTTKKSRIADPEGFWDWIKANPEFMEAAFNPNSIRKTGIPASVLDTFYEVVESDTPVVSSIPVHVLERNQQSKGN